MKAPLLILALALPTLPALEVHEWGTFTTVAGSDGVLLTGLEREEELLPPFVHHHPGFQNPRAGLPGLLAKGIRLPVANVRVKMETPVIYFHSDQALDARVRVDFDGGTISQWYPQRSAGETLPEAVGPLVAPLVLDFASPYRGAIEWDVEVLAPQPSREILPFHPDDRLTWTRARVPEANWLRDPASGETENFLFYRGLGNFDPGLHTRVDAAETLHLDNRTGHAIPHLLVFEKLDDGRIRWTETKDLARDASIAIPESRLAADRSPATLYHQLVDALAAQGLLRSEAEAMVRTWWSSYFETPGLRVFWVLPRPTTDRILPLQVEPTPDHIVRVLVGRSEVLRPRTERQYLELAGAEDDDRRAAWTRHVASDRFGLAHAERVAAIQAAAPTALAD